MRRSPRALALVDTQSALTYEELDRQAERLALHLKSAGVRADEVVGIYMERCAEFVVACLATLKAGGALLTLELAYPASLLREVIGDAKPRIVLTHNHYAQRLPRAQARFCLNEGWEASVDTSGGERGPRPAPESLAFRS